MNCIRDICLQADGIPVLLKHLKVAPYTEVKQHILIHKKAAENPGLDSR